MVRPIVEETDVAHRTIIRGDQWKTILSTVQRSPGGLRVPGTAAAYGPVEGGLQRECASRIEHVVKMAARDLDRERRKVPDIVASATAHCV